MLRVHTIEVRTMSKELTYEILLINGYEASPVDYIHFVATASLSQDEKKILMQAMEEVEVPSAPLKNSTELKKFLSELSLPIPPEKVMMFLKELPDELDSRKTATDHQKLLSIVPIEYLNKYSLPNLIAKTMNQDFWKPRVTNSDNKAFFQQRFGASAAVDETTIDSKIEKIESILEQETEWTQVTFAAMEREAGSKERYLEQLINDAKILGIDIED